MSSPLYLRDFTSSCLQVSQPSPETSLPKLPSSVGTDVLAILVTRLRTPTWLARQSFVYLAEVISLFFFSLHRVDKMQTERSVHENRTVCRKMADLAYDEERGP